MSATNIKNVQGSPPSGGLGDKKYTGVIIPAITPLTEKLQIDEAAVSRLFTLFYQHKISPFILGTTGESASLPLQLKKDYVIAAGKNKKMASLLYAGIGSMCWLKV